MSNVLIIEAVNGQKTARIGTLTDNDNGNVYTLSLRRDHSEIGAYSVVISNGKNSQSCRMKYGGGELLSKCMKHFEDYMNEPYPGRFRVETH